MDVKQAIVAARMGFKTAFSEEPIENLGLEEVVFDDLSNAWQITVGFSRPWDLSGGVLASLSHQAGKRFYKVVTIADDNGRLISIRNKDS